MIINSYIYNSWDIIVFKEGEYMFLGRVRYIRLKSDIFSCEHGHSLDLGSDSPCTGVRERYQK